jgi:enoyl-[acyl-carrier protein] reductase I
MGLMSGKNVLVLGVANKHSIAWGIARALHAHGADVSLSYAGPKLEHRVRSLARQVDARFVHPCDVTSDAEIDQLFSLYAGTFGRLDGLVHAIAYAPTEDLNGQFVDISRQGYLRTLDVSAYSLIALTRRAVPLMTSGGSILAMSSYAAERVFPHYNVMAVAKSALECEVRYLGVELAAKAIRVNAISAGLVRTLAAQAMDHFQPFYRLARAVTPLRRNMTPEDVGGAAVYLLSDQSVAVTGQTVRLDGGLSALGITVPEGYRLDDADEDSGEIDE